ncbi:Scr1 family TA system antitoxin-like transcriptional regulator [Actinomadura xylanilytica]|uniref:Scr1 family TA system antitoxin-like transcriptional regulator n=1 Tax=Actinomadura xylanilytica TaxID=887459 RepID=UPI00255AD4A2|nr:Scr1 family TA system antitoxin-like transcriptional regulator [Actinomadura xylanilytica]MDL4771065.1 Scr1 family TA system antitoxin-like transcriptional regulator [Actinomadura xylanilytica]
MSLIESLDPDTSFRHWIAADLRFYREKADLSLSQMGRIIGCTRHTVSNIEHARDGFNLNDHQAGRADAFFGLNHHFARLVRYSRSAHDPDWYTEHVGLEARASLIRIFELAVIPGLLQTPDYAHALLTAGRTPDIGDQVAKRMNRQKILTKPTPPELWVLLAQSVLTLPVGGPVMMRVQLGHLLEMGGLPNVTIRVVPDEEGAHQGLAGAFKLLTVNGKDVVYTEANGGGRLVQGASEIQTFARWYDRIGAQALSERSSRSLIERVMEAMK